MGSDIEKDKRVVKTSVVQTPEFNLNAMPLPTWFERKIHKRQGDCKISGNKYKLTIYADKIFVILYLRSVKAVMLHKQRASLA